MRYTVTNQMEYVNQLLTIAFIMEGLGTLVFLAVVGLMVWIILSPPADDKEH